jgi:7,8-dihydropterin-6-yl-methyl-4-(beta-D-ribofuranosyl)aminobenzene 5'-phosphate synthase
VLMRKSFVVFFLAIAVVLLAAGMQQDFNHNGRKQMQRAEPNSLTVDVNNISITVIYDNNPYKEGLETSWGFSCVITGTKKTILFDTGGNGQLLLENMSKMGIDANDIEIVVLSHIHGDHTGGLEGFLKKNPKVTVYLPESFPKGFKKKITSLTAKVVEVDKQTEICKNVYSTGQMGTFIKEQGLVLRAEKGLVVITGCAHPGIIEMVKTAKDLFDEQILLVMGGFHLEWATKNSIENIIKAFKDMNVKYAGPCHCTGNKARAIFAEHFGDNYINVGVGRTVRIEDLK